MCCATRWRSIRAACTSAPPVGRCTHRPMRATIGLPSSEIFRPCCFSKFRRCQSHANMLRVMLPAHLQTIAQVNGEVKLDVEGQVTQKSLLDALEARYPVLRGTI